MSLIKYQEWDLNPRYLFKIHRFSRPPP